MSHSGGTSFGRIALRCAVSLIALLFFTEVYGMYTQSIELKRENTLQKSGKELIVALKIFTSDCSGGVYPDDLKQLVQQKIVADEAKLETLLRIPRGKGEPDTRWLYFRGLEEAGQATDVVLATPPLSKHNDPLTRLWKSLPGRQQTDETFRVVAMNSGHVVSVGEEEFKHLLESSRQQLPLRD